MLTTSPQAIQSNEDNTPSLQTFLKDSFSSAKNHINNGFTAFREEVAGLYNRAEGCFLDMTSPINNFIKDFSQIDNEFTSELSRSEENFSAPFANVIPIEQALRSPMEENY